MKKIRYSTKMNALFALLVALVIGIAFMFNAVTLVLSNRYPMAIDLNANAAYEIGDETQRFLDTLTQDVTIYVLAREESFDGNVYLVQARRILNQYPRYSNHIRLQYVDYAVDPTIAAQFADLTLAEGNILVCAGDRVRQLQLANLFNYTYSGNGGLTVESSRAEEALSSAIVNVLADHTVRLGILTGNGVSDMSALTALLTDNNYSVENVSLINGALSDYDGLMLFAPTVDLSEEVLNRLDTFLYNDGNYGRTLMCTCDVSQPEMPNLSAFLSEWGVAVRDGAVFETDAERVYQYQPYYPLTDYADADRAAKLKDPNTHFLAPLSREIDILFDVRDNRYTEQLLSFYPSSGVRPGDAGADFTAANAVRHGPLPMLVLSSVRIMGNTGVTQQRSNLLLSASTQAFAPASLQNSSLSNAEYLLNLFNELFAREETLNVEAKSLAKATLGVTTAQANRLGILLAGVVPALILTAGIAVWLVRRYK